MEIPDDWSQGVNIYMKICLTISLFSSNWDLQAKIYQIKNYYKI